VGYTYVTAHVLVFECILKPFHLAQAPHALKFLIMDYRQARRIVPTVFQALKPLHEDGYYVALGYCAYDSAHEALSSQEIKTIIAKRRGNS
jgi:hypothetical protein